MRDHWRRRTKDAETRAGRRSAIRAGDHRGLGRGPARGGPAKADWARRGWERAPSSFQRRDAVGGPDRAIPTPHQRLESHGHLGVGDSFRGGLRCGAGGATLDRIGTGHARPSHPGAERRPALPTVSVGVRPPLPALIPYLSNPLRCRSSGARTLAERRHRPDRMRANRAGTGAPAAHRRPRDHLPHN